MSVTYVTDRETAVTCVRGRETAVTYCTTDRVTYVTTIVLHSHHMGHPTGDHC